MRRIAKTEPEKGSDQRKIIHVGEQTNLRIEPTDQHQLEEQPSARKKRQMEEPSAAGESLDLLSAEATRCGGRAHATGDLLRCNVSASVDCLLAERETVVVDIVSLYKIVVGHHNLW
jgi:hypothetical protein